MGKSENKDNCPGVCQACVCLFTAITVIALGELGIFIMSWYLMGK